MRTLGAALLSIALLAACSSTPRGGDTPSPQPAAAAAAADPADSTYGYSPQNPIKVGGVKEEVRPARQHEFLRALRGPAGQVVRYQRRGSCCPYDTPNGLIGNRGLLDVYEVTYDGLAEPIVLYLTLYDFEEPRAPRGFTLQR
ncbi:MAG TPA: hypothetical protein VKA84_24370 [Gemmatimonadaceae bacterium]|nr:hypothetical protein [Gemmatimonadaceae bacterium]